MKSRVQIEAGNMKEGVVRGLMKARVLNQRRNFNAVGSRNNCSTLEPFSDDRRILKAARWRRQICRARHEGQRQGWILYADNIRNTYLKITCTDLI
jgi:hypothetical protein